MSEDQKSSFAEKAAKAAAIGAGIVAAAAVIPQDELMKDGLPGLWESIKGIAQKGWLHLNIAAEKFHPIAFRWLGKLWSFIKWWTLLSFALIFAGIEVKTRFGSNFGHVLVAAGTISVVGLGILLFALSDGIASILYFKIRLAGGVLGKVASVVGVDLSQMTGITEAGAAAKAEKFHDKVKFVLAGTVVLSFSLLFTMFFPAWSTLGWTLCFWAMVSVALVAALHLNLKMGKAVQVVFYLTIGLIVAMFVVFLIDRLTDGAIGFSGFQKWLLGSNRSEIILAILVLVPSSILIVSLFVKDKDMKAAYRQAAKYVGLGALVLGVFLYYKDTITWKQATGKEAPDLKWPGSKKAASTSPAKLDPTPVPQVTRSNGGTYMTPPTGDPMPTKVSSQVPSKPVRARTGRASKPLPKEEPKKYSNMTQGVDDLEALGY